MRYGGRGPSAERLDKDGFRRALRSEPVDRFDNLINSGCSGRIAAARIPAAMVQRDPVGLPTLPWMRKADCFQRKDQVDRGFIVKLERVDFL